MMLGLFLLPFVVTYISIFEWVLHRYLMHRPVGPFVYAYNAHALVHHRIFKADHTYHLINEKDKETIPMAWWNGPVLMVIASALVIPVGIGLGSWLPVAMVFVGSGIYYGCYEYLHWCMHLPKARPVERSGIFFRLNGHHLLHHRYPHKNFNVVLPIADFLFGTLLTRALFSFDQAKGPAVPDVQPAE